MPKFRVMVERIEYTPFFKTIEAPTEEEANKLGQADADNLRGRQDLDDVGWVEGDHSMEYEVREDVIEKLED